MSTTIVVLDEKTALLGFDTMATATGTAEALAILEHEGQTNGWHFIVFATPLEHVFDARGDATLLEHVREIDAILHEAARRPAAGGDGQGG